MKGEIAVGGRYATGPFLIKFGLNAQEVSTPGADLCLQNIVHEL